jgi:hypothetical protein
MGGEEMEREVAKLAYHNKGIIRVTVHQAKELKKLDWMGSCEYKGGAGGGGGGGGQGGLGGVAGREARGKKWEGNETSTQHGLKSVSHWGVRAGGERRE